MNAYEFRWGFICNTEWLDAEIEEPDHMQCCLFC